VLRALDGGLLAPHPRLSLAAAVLFGCAYAVIDEIHQSFVPGRESSIRDAIVDSCATLAASTALAWAARRDPEAEGPRIEMLTREGCHLCDDARRALEEALGPSGARWEEVDVDGRPELAALYWTELPVVLIDGVKRFKGRIDRDRLRTLLAQTGRLRNRREAGA
jgi:glutaredoxin